MALPPASSGAVAEALKPGRPRFCPVLLRRSLKPSTLRSPLLRGATQGLRREATVLATARSTSQSCHQASAQHCSRQRPL